VAGHYGPGLPGTLEANFRVPASVQTVGTAQTVTAPNGLPVKPSTLNCIL